MIEPAYQGEQRLRLFPAPGLKCSTLRDAQNALRIPRRNGLACRARDRTYRATLFTLKRRRAGPHRFVGNFLPGQEGTAFRVEYAGAHYHVMARGDCHEATLKDEEAREILSRNVPWDSLLPMDQLEPTRKSETTRLSSLKRLNAHL